jgi:hypothetical protein
LPSPRRQLIQRRIATVHLVAGGFVDFTPVVGERSPLCAGVPRFQILVDAGLLSLGDLAWARPVCTS